MTRGVRAQRTPSTHRWRLMAYSSDPIGPFLHYLMAECGVSPNTLAAYRGDLVHFMRWRKEHRSWAAGQLLMWPTLAGYVEFLSRSGSAALSSIGRHLASLSTFFRYLIYEGKLSENLAKLLIAPAVWDRLPTVLSPTAIERLLEAPEHRDSARAARTRAGARDPVRHGLPCVGSGGATAV